MLNRKTPPIQAHNGHIEVKKAQELILPNGIKLLTINAGTQEVSRTEFIFNAGTRFQKKVLTSRGAITMLTEGTATLSSMQIAEQFDFYGSYVEQTADRDFGGLTLFSLNKFLPQSLELVEKVLKTPTYPEKEIQTYRVKGKQTLQVELGKVSTLVRQKFFDTIFGANHPYGEFAQPEDYDKVEQADLLDFQQKHISSTGCTIFLAGKISDAEVALIEKLFGQEPWGKPHQTDFSLPSLPQTFEQKQWVEKADAVQSAIRVGRRMFPRTHPDFPGMAVLNTILGGYFGSRLMKNLREDKGYTYGVSSGLAPLRESGFWVAGAEVGSEFTLPALEQIYLEINRLRTELIPNEELSLVRNYLLGEALRTFDGPFATAETITSLYEYNDLDYSFLHNMLHTIHNITSKELMELANKYLNPNDLIECVAGSVSNI